VLPQRQILLLEADFRSGTNLGWGIAAIQTVLVEKYVKRKACGFRRLCWKW
jgi:hypothetical protein